MLKNTKLRWYQSKALQDLAGLPAIGLLFDTGTGKTITSLWRADSNPTSNILVLCPSSIVNQWGAKMIEVMPDNYHKYIFDRSVKTASQKNDVIGQLAKKQLDTNTKIKNNMIVISLETVAKYTNLKDLVDEDWTIILDESHKIKELGRPRSPVQVTKAVLELGTKTPYKIIMTATPVQKANGGYIDYYTQLRFLGYIDYSLDYFKKNYCVLKKIQIPGSPYPIDTITGYKPNIIEIQNLVANTCRSYEAKFGDFEPEHVLVLIDQCKSYASFIHHHAYKNITCDNSTLFRNAKKQLTTGVISGTGEFDDRYMYEDNANKLNWLKELLSNTNETVAICYQFGVELLSLQKLCKSLGKTFIEVNGRTKDKYKEINEKEYDVALLQYQAASLGLDGLHLKCHIMVLFAMPESSEKYTQIIGRIYRDGQTKVPIYYHLVMDRTIDSTIYELNMNKVAYREQDLDNISIKGLKVL